MTRGIDKNQIEPLRSLDSVDYEKWHFALLNLAAGYVDDRGWSLADHTRQDDEGSRGNPYPSGTPVQIDKMSLLYRKRSKGAYGLIIANVAEPGLYKYISLVHFQDASAAMTHL